MQCTNDLNDPVYPNIRHQIWCIDGLNAVIIYPNNEDSTLKNRGFAFLEYDCHKSAVKAKQRIRNPGQRVFGVEVTASWAEPQDEPDEEIMSKVRCVTLYIYTYIYIYIYVYIYIYQAC